MIEAAKGWPPRPGGGSKTARDKPPPKEEKPPKEEPKPTKKEPP